MKILNKNGQKVKSLAKSLGQKIQDGYHRIGTKGLVAGGTMIAGLLAAGLMHQRLNNPLIASNYPSVPGLPSENVQLPPVFGVPKDMLLDYYKVRPDKLIGR